MSRTSILDATALPLRPGTATRVLAMIDEPDTSAADIGAVARTEPAIAARLLALANSPVFRRGNTVADINRAVAVVGMNSVRGIALGVAMDRLFEDDSGLDPAHWEHSLVVAGASVTTAQHTGVDSGEAFCAGLMHDIGRIAMAIASPEDWTKLSAGTVAGNKDQMGLEVELFGVNHALLGSQILTEFGLPDRLVMAVGTHHDPLNEIDSALGRCVAVGEVVAEVAAGGSDEAAELESLLPDLGLDAESLLTKMKQQTAELRSAFLP